MNAFTIKDLESLSGIKAHTIRIWEQRYSFLKPQRTETNIRYYTSEELKTLLNIALLNKYGFKISHIDKMEPNEIADKLITLTDTRAQQERMVNEMIGFMVDMHLDKFEEVLNKHILSKGIDRAIQQLIFPFLERIGILWQTNHINPAQEHLVTNIIRQKLIAGIEKAAPLFTSTKTILLFLPEGEYHELGLLYIYYMLKNRGVRVLYLGASVPLKDVVFLAETKQPYHIYTHVTAMSGNARMERYLNNLRERVPQTPIVVSGQLAQSSTNKTLPGIDFKRSIAEVVDYISGI